MLKFTETSKKSQGFKKKKLQKIQVFGKNCKNFKFLEKNLQSLINLANFFVASDLFETIYVRTEFENEFKLHFKRHHIETMIQKRE